LPLVANGPENVKKMCTQMSYQPLMPLHPITNDDDDDDDDIKQLQSSMLFTTF